MGGQQDADYAAALTKCESLAELRELITVYAELAVDAKAVVDAMTEAEWPAFVKGLKSERRGKFAGDDWAKRYGAILMPMPMMRISEIASQFQAPFGVAWQRCRDIRPDFLAVKSPVRGVRVLRSLRETRPV